MIWISISKYLMDGLPSDSLEAFTFIDDICEHELQEESKIVGFVGSSFCSDCIGVDVLRTIFLDFEFAVLFTVIMLLEL